MTSFGIDTAKNGALSRPLEAMVSEESDEESGTEVFLLCGARLDRAGAALRARTPAERGEEAAAQAGLRRPAGPRAGPRQVTTAGRAPAVPHFAAAWLGSSAGFT
jgi:hypothetical protein